MSNNHSSTSNLVEVAFGKETKSKKVSSFKNTTKLVQTLYDESKKGKHGYWSGDMKRIKVYSNHARSKNIVLGSKSELVMSFDRHGIASVPQHLLPILKQEMKLRPGRFKIVSEDYEKKANETAVFNAEVSVELSSMLDQLKEEEKKEQEEQSDSEED